jgi:translation initiation factor IF-2-like protein
MMSPDSSKQDCLLPKGCKNLIDAAKPQPAPTVQAHWPPGQPSNQPPATQPPPITGIILVSEKTTVGGLAALLGQKPFKIVTDAMELGVFANVNQSLDFWSMARIAWRYGIRAKKSA